MLITNDIRKRTGWFRPITIIFVVLLHLLDRANAQEPISDSEKCGTTCSFTLVESIPQNLTFPPGSPRHPSVFEGWMNLLDIAEESIEIGSFYWTLRGSDGWADPSDWQGERIFQELLNAGINRNVTIKIAQNLPSSDMPNYDTPELERRGAAQVRSVNFTRLFGAGILHTKMWVVDRKHFYVGSANFDWRSMTQVKEVGMVVYNCSCMAEDLSKIFQIYWLLGLPDAVIPPNWPTKLDTEYNSKHPAQIFINQTLSNVYLSSSPPPFCTDSRTSDIQSILNVIGAANKFIYVAVMDYFPVMLYSGKKEFWPVIDDALRKAAYERGVTVRVLGSHWNHTRPDMPEFLSSLAALNNSFTPMRVEVKLFVVPSFTQDQANIPFARVNHNKYMVTDNAAYIGTSNWSGDYFIDTAGVGLIVNQTAYGNSSQPVREQMQAVFERDWFSSYALPVSNFEHRR